MTAIKSLTAGLLAGLILFLTPGFLPAQSPQILLVVPPRDFHYREVDTPRKVFTQAGFKVILASRRLGDLPGLKGGKVRPDRLLTQVAAQDFDAVLFVGGPGAARYLNDPQAQALARQGLQHGKVVAASSQAVMILARAQLLKGKKATCPPAHKKELAAAGAKFVEAPVVQDGKLLTASGPGAARDLAHAIVELLKAKP